MNEKCDFNDHWKNVLKKVSKQGLDIQRRGRNFTCDFNRIMVGSTMNGSIGHCLPYVQLPDRLLCSKINSKINSALKTKFVTSEERRDPGKFNRMSQYTLMGRSKLVSLENQSRIAKLTRLNKIAMTGLPAREFNRLMECFEDQIHNRRNGGVPILTPFPRINRDKHRRIIECQPYSGILELNRLPRGLKMHFGTKNFDFYIKKYFGLMCQHTERQIRFCDNCEASTNLLREEQISTTELNKMIEGGQKIRNWTKYQNFILAPVPEFRAEENEKMVKLLQTHSLETTNLFLKKVREMNFWNGRLSPR